MRFDIRNREALYEVPPETDKFAWEQYLNDQKDAESFKRVPDVPVQIDFELNGSCNMRCPFCIHGNGGGRIKSNLSLDVYKKLIDEAVSLGTKSVKLNYINEPLLRTDLEEAIQYARLKGILNIYFVTNGLLLNKERRDSLLKSGVTKIGISIDASSAETYNKQRKNGYYDEIIENVRNLVQERNLLGQEFPKIRVSFLKNKLNEHEEDAFAKLWTDVADIITFQKMNEVPEIDTGLTLPDNIKPPPCSFPNKLLVVDSEGDILPCCTLYGKELVIGNISNMSLEEAWNSFAMKRLREAHANDTWEKIESCRRCLCQ